MSKALAGAEMLAGAVVDGALMFALASTGVGFAALPFLGDLMVGLVAGGVASEAGALASALTSNRGMGITTRQPAAFRQVVRGRRRIAGTILYQSTTGSHKDQYNFCIVLAGIPLYAVTGLYLDGRQVFWNASSPGYSNLNGQGFGGTASGGNHTGPDGQQYNFDGLVYCEVRNGRQLPGDVITGFTANDPSWAAGPNGSPYVGGCAYVYLKIEFNQAQFPSLPEIRFTVAGKDDIYDPRTGTYGYTDNWALHVADHLSLPQALGGFGAPYINEDQLIAAANICDEQVVTSQGNESRYVLSANYDMSMAPGSVLSKMLDQAGGRVRRIGGERYIYPGAWAGPSYNFGPGDLCSGIESTPVLGIDQLCNRVTGTYTAPNYPYNVAGDLYDSNGFYNGSTQNNWNFAWQSTNYPQYARDPAHGYSTAIDLNQDSGVLGFYNLGITYMEDDVVTYLGAIWRSVVDNNTDVPSAASPNWVNGAVLLSEELNLEWCISITQAQRVAKMHLMRTRYQGRYKTSMFLRSYGMASLDVANFTQPALGWSAKPLEVDDMTLQAVERGQGQPPALQVSLSLADTDPSIYEWTDAEEQTIYAALAIPSYGAGPVAPPTGLTLVSSTATAVPQADGSLDPRIQATWTPPEDAYVNMILVQYRLTGTINWVSSPSVEVSTTTVFIDQVIAGQAYDVRIAGQRATGAVSAWAEVDDFTAGLALNVSTESGFGVNELTASAFPNGTAEITVQPFTANLGLSSLSYLPGGPVTIMVDGTLSGAGGTRPGPSRPGPRSDIKLPPSYNSVPLLAQGVLYYVYLNDSSLTGGDLTPVATINPTDYYGIAGVVFIGSIVTPYAGAAAATPGLGQRFYPGQYSTAGTRTTVSPAAGFDGNSATFAVVSAASFTTSSGGTSGTYSAGGWLSYFGWAPQTLGTDATLTVLAGYSTVNGAVSITALVNDVSTALLSTSNASTTVGSTAYTLDLPAGTDFSKVSVQLGATTAAAAVGSPNSASLNVFEVFIQT